MSDLMYDSCCGACGQGYDKAERHRCDLDPAGGEWLLTVRFMSDSLEDAMKAIDDASAQFFDGDGITEVKLDWTELSRRASAVAFDWMPMTRLLHDVAWLASAAFRLTVGYSDVQWLCFDWDDDLVRSDLGTMRISDFREYYTKGKVG